MRSDVPRHVCGVIAAIWVWASTAVSVVAQETVTLDAMLIHASNRPAALDTRLDRVEYRLRRVFGFEHYGFVNQSQTLLTLPAHTRMDLVGGYVMQIDASSRDGRIRANVQWFQNGRRLLSTSIAQRRGVPAILGGPPHDEGALILVLEFR